MWLSKPPLGTPLKRGWRTDGLVGYWAFQEGGGDKVYDLSGNGNDGTLTNMAFPPTATSGWNPGKDGECLAFDQVNDFVTMGDVLDIRNDSWSVSCRLNFDSLSSAKQYIIGKFTGDPTNHPAIGEGYALYLNTNYVLRFEVMNTTPTYNWATITITGWTRWHTIVGTFDRSVVKLYIDGLLVDTSTSRTWGDIKAGPNPLVLGRHSFAGLSYFNGLIDNVSIYNRELSADEVFGLYTDPWGIFDFDISNYSQIDSDSVLNLESLSTVVSDSSVLIDSLKRLVRDNVINADWLSRIIAEKSINADWLKQVVKDGAFNADWLKQTIKDNTLNVDWIKNLTIDNAINIEWLGQIKKDNVSNIDWLRRVFESCTANISWAKQVIRDANLNIEYMVLGKILFIYTINDKSLYIIDLYTKDYYEIQVNPKGGI